MHQRRLLERPGRLAQATALASLVVVLLLVVIGGLATPGYQHASQFISELEARGAPTEWAVLGWASACGVYLARSERSQDRPGLPH